MNLPFKLDYLGRQPYRDFHPHFLRALSGFAIWPSPEQYDELARAVPQAADVSLPGFVSESREALRRLGGYEAHVAKLGTVPTRPASWHDFFNMMNAG